MVTQNILRIVSLIIKVSLSEYKSSNYSFGFVLFLSFAWFCEMRFFHTFTGSGDVNSVHITLSDSL